MNIMKVLVVLVVAVLVWIGAMTLAFTAVEALAGKKFVWSQPEAGWNDRYEGEWYTVVKTIPAEDIVDREKLKDLGGEECRFFVTNGFDHPLDHDVRCVILQK